MGDDITIGVTEIVNNIEVTAQPNDQIVDISVIDNADEVTLNITPTVIEINVNKGSSYARWGTIYGNLTDQTDLTNALILKADLVDGKVPAYQLPSFVDDVVEVANYAALPAMGEIGKIYVTLDNNKIYRWSGSIYIEIAANNAIWGAITGTLSSQTDLQNALNLKANDNAVVHLTGNETISGTKSFTDNGSSSSIYCNVTSTNGVGISIDTSSTNGSGIYCNNTSTGIGIESYNTAEGAGIYSQNSSTGDGINSRNTSTGDGINSYNSGGGNGIYSYNNGTGCAIKSDNVSSGTGILSYNITGTGIRSNNVGTGTGFNSNNSNTGTGISSNNSAGGTGISSSNSSTGNGINSLNNGTGIGIGSTNNSTGSGIYSINQSTGKGIYSSNSSTGIGFYSSNSGGITSIGIRSDNTSSGTGFYSVNNSTGYGIRSDNNGAGEGIYSQNSSTGTGFNSTNSSTGTGILSQNSSTGEGINSINSSTGKGIYSANVSSGKGIFSTNVSTGTGIESQNSSTGKGIYSINTSSGRGIFSENASTGDGIYSNNTSSGKGLVLNNTTAATGMPFTVSKNGTDKFTINDAGEATGVKFIKSGGTSSQFLKADGSVDSTTYQAALTNPVTGTGTTNYIPKFTGASAIGNSSIFDNGQVNIGSTSFAGDELLMVSMNGTTNTQAINVKDRNASGNGSTFMVFRKSDDTFLGNIRRSGTSDALYIGGNSFLALGHSGNTEAMRITSGGNVGIGNISPTSAGGYATLSIGGSGSTKGQITWNSGATNIGYAYNDATNMTFGANNDLIFATTSSGNERMRITSSGNVGIFNTLYGINNVRSDGAYGGIDFYNSGTGYQYSAKIYTLKNSTEFYGLTNDFGAGTSGQLSIVAKGGGSNVGIYTDATERFRILTNGNYYFTGSNVSDERAKENIIDLEFNAIEKIMALRPKSYYMKYDSSQIRYGLIAQEVNKILPDLIYGDIEGEDFIGLDYNGIIPVLVKAIQELKADIELLKAK